MIPCFVRYQIDPTKRARLVADAVGPKTYEFAQSVKFILREDQVFLKLASAPHGKG
jgi:hypothetical protein